MALRPCFCQYWQSNARSFSLNGPYNSKKSDFFCLPTTVHNILFWRFLATHFTPPMFALRIQNSFINKKPMKLPLTDHAEFEIGRRNIKIQDVKQVFEKPQQKIILENDREIWQNKVSDGGRDYVLRLVLDTKPVLKIVTVYRSSKIDKYWRPS